MKLPATYRFACLFALIVSLWGCGKEGAGCLGSAGDLQREEIAVPGFSEITVFENVRLVVRQGPEQRVVLETGKNLRDGVSARVEDGVLELRDSNNCNLFREYGLTTFYVTAPDLGTIRSSTGWPIASDGVLAFDALTLISESFNNPETETTDGAFDMDLAAGEVRLVANGIAYFKLRGTAGSLRVTIAAGDSRVEASELVSGRVTLDHRGSNQVLVNPTGRLDGVIRGYGDVLSYNRPDTVDVEERYRGRLIFVE
ncbi:MULTISPECIES: head GIN domain-containing protein [Robiginitalea]|uniref:head GIN domain-containing protein n=1 Tax=Robiginitalea TaxID=252306 RepID=UPI00234ABC37|nr:MULTISPECIES: head GIN domain-containing protein [unclassified Robiginitalea]MDC6354539.1 DUF2807 domain-containing protein [Robiginitalea sp. PM2]MDC6374779.1 DUF2807 domain-containing protein [Robiginitalea sp. SP8]